MKSILEQVGGYLKNNDSWLYLAVILVLSAEKAINLAPHSWKHYLSCFVTMILCYLPLLLFVHFKVKLKQRFRGGRYLLLWIAFFGIWSGGIGWVLQNNWYPSFAYFDSADYFIGLGFGLAGLDVAIEINRHWKEENAFVSRLKKISLDRAILLGIFLFSILLSLMTVSNLEKFYSEELIIPSINLLKVGRHFFLFLTFIIQFSIYYVALYFFYLLNAKVLIPFLLKERGVVIYAVGVLGSIALFFPILAQLLIMMPLVQNVPALMPMQTLDIFTELNALIPFVVIVVSLPAIVALQWFQQNNKITNLEKQQVEQELTLLKQQINPHFFFNTLNNLYSLSLEKSDQGPEVIVQLSELMRYVIYKGKEKEVSVAEEVTYVKDYIQLQKIRLHKKVDLQFNENVAVDSMMMPPLLLIILIENAFKHGVEPAERNCFLHMDLKSDAQSLVFNCSNSFEPPLPEKEGIGLDNLKRRLELLYPSRHRLTTAAEGTTFTANLKIWIA